MIPKNNNGLVLSEVVSSCANILFNKFCSAASYAASCYIYQPANVDTLELNSAQSLLLALFHSSFMEDVAACVLIAEFSSNFQQLRSRYLKVWISEDFNFPPNNMKKGLIFMSQLLRKESIRLPSYLVSIFSFMAQRYKCSDLYFESPDEEEVSLENRLRNAVLNNSLCEIFSLGMKCSMLNKSQLLGSLLHIAISTNNIESMTALIWLGVDLEVKDSSGLTPLRKAVSEDNPVIVRALLEAGARANRRFIRGDTLLHLAAAGCYNKAAEQLLVGKISIDCKNYLGETPLFQAIKAGNIAGVEMLLRKGADPFIQTNYKSTPWKITFLSPDINIIKMIVKHVSSTFVDLTLLTGDSLIHSVVRFGNREVLEVLLKDKVSLEVENKDGYLPIHITTDPYILEMLIRSRRNIDSKTRNDETSLHLAAAKGCTDLVKVLIHLDANLDIKDSKGYTALSIAAENSKVEIVKLLLEGGAKPDIKNNKGFFTIHIAVAVGSLECILALLEAGVDVDSKTDNNVTPAMHAALNNKVEVLKLLQRHGADLTAKTKLKGSALIDFAIYGGAVDVKNWLLDNRRNCLAKK